MVRINSCNSSNLSFNSKIIPNRYLASQFKIIEQNAYGLSTASIGNEYCRAIEAILNNGKNTIIDILEFRDPAEDGHAASRDVDVYENGFYQFGMHFSDDEIECYNRTHSVYPIIKYAEMCLSNFNKSSSTIPSVEKVMEKLQALKTQIFGDSFESHLDDYVESIGKNDALSIEPILTFVRDE